MIAGDPQQRQCLVIRQPPGDGAERRFTVGKMTGVFPQQVAGERFRRIPVAGAAEKEMFEFPGQKSQIVNPVGAVRPFQVKGVRACAKSLQWEATYFCAHTHTHTQ